MKLTVNKMVSFWGSPPGLTALLYAEIRVETKRADEATNEQRRAVRAVEQGRKAGVPS